MIEYAKWITTPVTKPGAPVIFRKTVRLPDVPKTATAEISAFGCYSLFLNGSRVGNRLLTPGWTVYASRIQYQTYDLSGLLRAGENRIEIEVAPGWASGAIAFQPDQPTVTRLAAVFAFSLTFPDGSGCRFRSDTDWEVCSSRILYSDIYHGETVDLTAPLRHLGKAVASDFHTALIPQINEPVTEQERIAPLSVFTTPKGETVIDFGQNLAGYVEVRIRAPRGARIVLHHAEVLDRDGNFYTDNLRGARNLCTYICDGGENRFRPSYSYQGFRYVRLTEFPFSDPDPAVFRAVVIHSELQRTGQFVCGSEPINRLYENMISSLRSNFIDVPTDCPQRDERLGWTGDVLVFAKTAALCYGVSGFFRKWLGDLRADQSAEGWIPWVVPNRMLPFDRDFVSAGWGDVCCVLPWELYLAYGDASVLAENFGMMRRWVDAIRRDGSTEALWLPDRRQFGDWLASDRDPEQCNGLTSTDLIATAFFAHSTDLLIRAGHVLGEDMSDYERLLRDISDAYRARFFPGGRISPQLSETQTSYVLTLAFGLCSGQERPVFAARLADMIREKDNHMTTGFLGTAYLLHVLSDNGYASLAYDLLLQETPPSWLWSVKCGATTVWEHWNGQREDGSFWNPNMNSFNHYAYGAVFDWVIGVACGIKPSAKAPGYQSILIAPHPDPRLGHAQATLETAHGRLLSGWAFREGHITYTLRVPKGCRAHLQLPGGYSTELSSGAYRFYEATGE